MRVKNNSNTIETDKPDAVSSELYRDVMRYFAGAVHIVTTTGVAGLRGITVSACCSLSDNPPTLLICVMKQPAVY